MLGPAASGEERRPPFRRGPLQPWLLPIGPPIHGRPAHNVLRLTPGLPALHVRHVTAESREQRAKATVFSSNVMMCACSERLRALHVRHVTAWSSNSNCVLTACAPLAVWGLPLLVRLRLRPSSSLSMCCFLLSLGLSAGVLRRLCCPDLFCSLLPLKGAVKTVLSPPKNP